MPSKMTRQDFQMIADVLAGAKPHDTELLDYWYHLTQEFATALARTNPMFNRSRFLEACGSKFDS